eukprot:TRINITY_DN14587_c0_g1_i5.p1 TRINITY_DN14587_c0_g1~~TRINITY_DN14587_c0_g1_i5.p1  ORF type:complete len:653 (+),score=148.43 TRINITY_DN14587_c0_g1_i5:91-2049(+)
MLRLLRSVLVSRALRENDSPDEKIRKRVCLPVLFAIILASVISLLLRFPRAHMGGAANVGVMLMVCAAGVCMLLLHRHRPVPPSVIEMLLLLCFCGTQLVELELSSRPRNGVRIDWALVMFGVLVAFGARPPAVYTAFGVALAVQLLLATEEASGWGLFQFAWFRPTDRLVDIQTGCVEQPCRDTLSALDQFTQTSVASTIDLWIKMQSARYYFRRVRDSEWARRTWNEVAEHLVRYKTEEAHMVLKNSSALGQRERALLMEVIANQQRDRMYLPNFFGSNQEWSDGSEPSGPQSSANASPVVDSRNPFAPPASGGAASASPGEGWTTPTSWTEFSGVMLQSGSGVFHAKPARPRSMSKRTSRRRPQRNLRLPHLPKLNTRQVSLVCAELDGLVDSSAMLGGAVVESISEVFLDVMVETSRNWCGVLHTFDEGAAILSFGAAATSPTSCMDACRCAASILMRDQAMRIDIERVIAPETEDPASSPCSGARRLGGVLMSVDYDRIMTGEVSVSSDRRSVTFLSSVVGRTRELCKKNRRYGTQLICTERVWDRMQAEEWVTARELDNDIFELIITKALSERGTTPTTEMDCCTVSPMSQGPSTVLSIRSGESSLVRANASTVTSTQGQHGDCERANPYVSVSIEPVSGAQWRTL